MKPKLPIGQRVRHDGHGLGTITLYNRNTGKVPETMYGFDRFPYEVTFDSGFKEVYRDQELEVVDSPESE